jgi:hypothetical protein
VRDSRIENKRKRKRENERIQKRDKKKEIKKMEKKEILLKQRTGSFLRGAHFATTKLFLTRYSVPKTVAKCAQVV